MPGKWSSAHTHTHTHTHKSTLFDSHFLLLHPVDIIHSLKEEYILEISTLRASSETSQRRLEMIENDYRQRLVC